MSIASKLESCITVEGLIGYLKRFDPQARVLFACPYGDRGRTIQALPVESMEEYDASTISETAYSESGMAFDEDGSEDEELDGKVVILQS